MPLFISLSWQLLPASLALNTSLVVTLIVRENSTHVGTFFTAFDLDVFLSANHNTSHISFAGAVFVARSKASNHCYSSESQNNFFHINLFINLLCLL